VWFDSTTRPQASQRPLSSPPLYLLRRSDVLTDTNLVVGPYSNGTNCCPQWAASKFFCVERSRTRNGVCQIIRRRLTAQPPSPGWPHRCRGAESSQRQWLGVQWLSGLVGPPPRLLADRRRESQAPELRPTRGQSAGQDGPGEGKRSQLKCRGGLSRPIRGVPFGVVRRIRPPGGRARREVGSWT
jgi:hypothetical protein